MDFDLSILSCRSILEVFSESHYFVRLLALKGVKYPQKPGQFRDHLWIQKSVAYNSLSHHQKQLFPSQTLFVHALVQALPVKYNGQLHWRNNAQYVNRGTLVISRTDSDHRFPDRDLDEETHLPTAEELQETLNTFVRNQLSAVEQTANKLRKSQFLSNVTSLESRVLNKVPNLHITLDT